MSQTHVTLKITGARGHQTFYRKMIQRPEAPIQAGRIVEVRDRQGFPVGFGFYHPRSQIAVRMISFGKKEPDAAYFEERLRNAFELRSLLGIPETTTAFRLCHAEGDGLSGLIIDRLESTVVVQLHSLGMYHRMEWIRPALEKLFPEMRMILQADEGIMKIEGFTLPRQKPVDVIVQEYGVRFHVAAGAGQKTGFFCDQRDSRAGVGRIAGGRRVLDLCTYTGGFALHAAKGGAKSVVGIDLDETALATARRNAKLNKVDAEFRHAELFNYLRQSKQMFDLIILDPPKMARDPKELPRARKSYADMNQLAFGKVDPGGIVVSCSCSGLISESEFLELLRGAARKAGRTLHTFYVGGAGPDHPVSSLHPEGRYLKVAFSVVR